MENNQLQCAAFEPIRHHVSHSFHYHPLCLSVTSLCFHPHKLPLVPRSLLATLLSVCLSLNFWPQDPVGTSPRSPLALKNRLTKNITHLHRHTKPIHDIIRQQSVWAPCVCVPAYLCLHRRCVVRPVSGGHSQSAPQPLWQPDLAALRKLHPATQTTHQPQQRFSTNC